MPKYSKSYKKKSYSRRKYKKRPNLSQLTFRNPQTIAQAAYGAYKGYNMLKGIINSELKRFDTNTATTLVNTGVITCINQIAAGDDVNNRQGNSILGKYLTWNYQLVMDAAAVHSNIRCMIIADTENIGVAPSLSDILQVATANNNITSPINVDTTDRYTVLYDRLHALSATGQQSVVRKVYRGLNFHLKYTNTGSSGFQKNSLFLVMIADNATNPPSITYSTRLAYYDN